MASGLDRVASGDTSGLEGRRVALLCNHTAVDDRGQHAARVLEQVPGTEVVRLLGPEHGVWSTHQDMEPVLDGPPVDPFLRLPVLSLYGHDVHSLTPDAGALKGVDAVVYDVRDIGTRFYTYAATLAFTMETAAKEGVPVWVLDRPNPIGSSREGILLREGFESFCGIESGLPVRHGMTVGELARWYAARRSPEVDLHVVPCDPDGIDAWVMPSPNMPTVDTAIVYPGMCLLEGTTLSEGRGTTAPFLLFGAPGVPPVELAEALNQRGLSGVDFVPRVFRPEFGKHAGQLCGGATIRVREGDRVHGLRLGVHVLDVLHRLAPNAFGWRPDAYEFVEDVPAIDLLWGSPDLRHVLEAGEDIGPLLDASDAEANGFQP